MNPCIDRMIAATSESQPNGATGRATRMGRCLLAGLALVVSASASATIVTFDGNALVESAGNAVVQAYMPTIVSGVAVAGSDATTTSDNGDGFVAGPTLGPDTFNTSLGSDHFAMDSERFVNHGYNKLINGCSEGTERGACAAQSSVPEPSPLPLLAAGLAVMIFAMRRRKLG